MFRLGLGLGLTNRFRTGSSLPAGSGVLAATGQATAAFTGAADARGALSAQGTGAAAFVGSSTTAGQGTLSSAGTATASFVGRSEARGALSSAGVAASALVGSSTGGSDTTPDAFTFADVTDADFGSVHTGSVTITGINAATAVTISAGTFSIAGGSQVSSGNVNNGEVIAVPLAASTSPSTPTSRTLTVGGVSDTFTVTSRAYNTPTLAFVDDVGDGTSTWDIGVDLAVVAGDQITITLSPNADMSSPSVTWTHTLTSNEISGIDDLPAVSAVPSTGSYYARVSDNRTGLSSSIVGPNTITAPLGITNGQLLFLPRQANHAGVPFGLPLTRARAA